MTDRACRCMTAGDIGASGWDTGYGDDWIVTVNPECPTHGVLAQLAKVDPDTLVDLVETRGSREAAVDLGLTPPGTRIEDRNAIIAAVDAAADIYSPVSRETLEERARENDWERDPETEGMWRRPPGSGGTTGTWDCHLRRMFARSIRCADCGRWIEERRQDKAGVCFNCGFWLKLVGDPEGIRIRRADNEIWHYIDGGRRLAFYRQSLGHGGAEWRIRMLDDGRIISTNNLWHQGKVPDHFHDRLPVNAEVLPL